MHVEASHRARRAGLLIVGVVALALPAGEAAAQDAPTPPTTLDPTAAAPGAVQPATPATASGRQWLVPVPTGCTVPALPDVVFVGTLAATGTPAGAPTDSSFDTARFRVDQARAGAVDRYSYNGMVDVRLGIDTKDLEQGEQYLVGASVDPAAGVLVSKVRQLEPSFGGDDVIAAAEADVQCPTIADPVRTIHVDGTPVDASVIAPFVSSKGRLLRAFMLPGLVAFGIIFALVALRWLITGVIVGVGSVVRTASEPREVRAAVRTRPNVNRDLEDANRR